MKFTQTDILQETPHGQRSETEGHSLALLDRSELGTNGYSTETEERRSVCRATVIGAGPYGLSVAAHLKAAGIETRTFGEPMSFWQANMPAGMKLRSGWIASSLSDPRGRYTIDEYVRAGGMVRTEPIPIQDFVNYGQWFQRNNVPDLDTRKVLSVESAGTRFRILLEDGEEFESHHVIIAAGLANQSFIPKEFQGIPKKFISHTFDHSDLKPFAGRRVAVIGRGQSGIESAALLSEAGADVEVICRGPIHWIGADGQRRLLRAKTGVGPFPLDWIVEMPGAVRMWPAKLRNAFNKRTLRPAAAAWLKPRMGQVRLNPDRAVIRTSVQDDAITLHLDNGAHMTVDHVLLATGYKPDVSRPGILAPELMDRLELHDDARCPVLRSHFEASVPGLHFVGSASVPSYGPMMRFVAGAGYAAQSVTQGILARKS